MLDITAAEKKALKQQKILERLEKNAGQEEAK